MLCATCRRSLLARLPTFKNHLPLLSRSVTTTAPATSNAAPVQPPPASSETTPPPSSASIPSTPTPKSRKVRSSVAGGAVLQGLGYMKAKPQIVAKEDEEYPDWLWTLLDEKGKSTTGSGGAGVDVAALTKKQRLKHDRKQAKLLKNLPPAVPLHEQSKDLTGPGDDAIVSLERRQEIVKSGRVARRKGIRRIIS